MPDFPQNGWLWGTAGAAASAALIWFLRGFGLGRQLELRFGALEQRLSILEAQLQGGLAKVNEILLAHGEMDRAAEQRRFEREREQDRKIDAALRDLNQLIGGMRKPIA
jgi:hypothetical protein